MSETTDTLASLLSGTTSVGRRWERVVDPRGAAYRRLHWCRARGTPRLEVIERLQLTLVPHSERILGIAMNNETRKDGHRGHAAKDHQLFFIRGFRPIEVNGVSADCDHARKVWTPTRADLTIGYQNGEA
jgi:hypothetical protein